MAKKRKAAAPAESLTIEERDLAKLRENPHNAKTHPPEQVRALAESIKEFGTPKVSITVNEKGVLLAGHGIRLGFLEAARLGYVPGTALKVMVARGWSPTKQRAFLEADNRLGELSGWDEDKRRRGLQHLRDQGFPMLAVGWERGLDEFIGQGAPPATFPSFGEDLETERQCPKCGYRFSGGKVPKEDGKKKTSKK